MATLLMGLLMADHLGSLDLHPQQQDYKEPPP
jgi:hypothetical protein